MDVTGIQAGGRLDREHAYEYTQDTHTRSYMHMHTHTHARTHTHTRMYMYTEKLTMHGMNNTWFEQYMVARVCFGNTYLV